MQIGYIGLGKMGREMVQRLQEKSHIVMAYNRSPEPRILVEKLGIPTVDTLEGLADSIAQPRVFWIMVDYKAVDTIILGLLPFLKPGDIVIDGGNSPYKESMRRANELTAQEIAYLDVGVSGGPEGARNGACMMVGGDEKAFRVVEPIIRDLCVENGYAYLGGAGAGHFAKMVHNGIEYGMMQAIAEGFNLLRESPFSYNVEKVAELYNHGSVIESRLLNWLAAAYREHGAELEAVSGAVKQSGEGKWALDEAKRHKIPVRVLEGAVQFRTDSQRNPSYIGKVLTALRDQFGKHGIKGR